MSGKTINWNRPMLERFKKAYSEAAGNDNSIFIFDGYEYVKGYARYLIEYLESRLPAAEKKQAV